MTATHFYAHGSLRCGHKGLFVDRLDAGVLTSGTETPRLVPAASLLVQNRNRTYSPAHGRFLQADPNETALMLQTSEAFHGDDGSSSLQWLALSHYGDGMNHYEYLGSNAWQRSDPLGLFMGGYAIDAGMTLGQMAWELTGTYSDNMEDDLNWALDWAIPDDAHSRLDNAWVSEILARNIDEALRSALLGPLADLQDAWDLIFAGKLRSFERMASMGLTIGGKAFRRMSHLHHALPRYIAHAIFGSRDKSKILIKIPKNLHSAYHEALNDAIKALGAPSMYRGAQALQDWINEVKNKKKRVQRTTSLLNTVRRTTAQFARDNNLEGLVEALDEALGLAKE